MKLDYIHRFNAFGDCVVRLYDFDKNDALQFQQSIQTQIIESKQPLDLSQLDFIESMNCTAILCLAAEDEGMLTENGKRFICPLTMATYEKMIKLLEPYTLRSEAKTHQMLYDVDSSIDFLLSPAGT